MEAEPLLQVLDKDNDGIVDLLRYTVFDSAGSAKLIVEDNDLDGTLTKNGTKEKLSTSKYLMMEFGTESRNRSLKSILKPQRVNFRLN